MCILRLEMFAERFKNSERSSRWAFLNVIPILSVFLWSPFQSMIRAGRSFNLNKLWTPDPHGHTCIYEAQTWILLRLQAKEQLFTSIQFLTEMVQMILSKRLQHNSHGGADVELRKGSPGLHEMHGVPDLLEPVPDSIPMSKKKKGAESGLTRSRDVKFLRGDSMPSSSEFGASIPSLNDLEKRMLRQVSSSQSVPAFKGTTPTIRRPSGASLKLSLSKSDAEMQLVTPQAPAAPTAQQIGQPRQPVQADPPMLPQVGRMGMEWSGSETGCLRARNVKLWVEKWISHEIEVKPTRLIMCSISACSSFDSVPTTSMHMFASIRQLQRLQQHLDSSC